MLKSLCNIYYYQGGTMRNYNIAVIEGDGIGHEVIPAGIRLIEEVQRRSSRFNCRWQAFPWGCEYYLRYGEMMPADGLAQLQSFDAIYLGAVGYPSVPDHISLWGLLLPIRKGFEQYANIRPIKLLSPAIGRLKSKGPDEIDMLCVRENSEGEYSGVGGRVHRGTPLETAVQTSVFSRAAIERVMRYAFELARQRPRRHLTAVTKSNACQYSFVLWDEVFAGLASEYPDVNTAKLHVDAMAALMIVHPEAIDVFVASNLHADILTDLGAVLQGSMGMAASANLNPERRHPSMFEPVHGSAPDIAGKGLANPLGAIWAGSMMLDFLGEKDAAGSLFNALQQAVLDGEHLTPDLGGSSSTEQVCQAVIRRL
jgi:tartrate dehydrogenase/decarboxylase / D-malate dehydrogenase